MSKIIFISLLLLVLSSTSVFGQSKTEFRDLEKQTLDQILDKTKYDNRIAPTNTDKNGTVGAVILKTNMYLRHIEYICTKKQEWKVQVTFRHQWNDPRLTFNDRNGQVAYLSLEDLSRVWTPDTFISNSKLTQTHTDLKPNTLVRIHPNGDILFSIRLTTTMGCPMNLIHYPFDSQNCHLMFASYGYTTDDISLQWKESDPVQITKNLNIPDFTLNKFSTSYCNSKTNTGEYSCLKAEFNFKRESSKYICQWLLPTALLTFISFASFWLKPKKSTRVKFLATILVILYLHILYINNKASPNVSYSTAKDCWLSTCLLFVLIAFVEYGIVTIVDKINKQNNKDSKRHQNGKADPEGDAVALKPLVEEGKDNTEQNNKQYTVNQLSSQQNLVEKWRRAGTSSRIDILSAILFPLLFIVYIITFFCYQTLIQ